MARLALTFALGALACAALPSPGLFIAIGLGISAIGCGWLGYSQRSASGARRLAAAGAIAVGAIGCVLGALRVVMTLVAIDRIDGMLG